MGALENRLLPSRNDLRWFGVVVAAFFGLLGGVFWWAGASLAPLALWGVGIGLAALYYAIPPLRLPLYLGWMRLVRPIGWTVTHLLLALIFYGLVTPLGVSMRLFGRDPLRIRRKNRRKPSPDSQEPDSYWTPHDPGGDTPRYLRQT